MWRKILSISIALGVLVGGFFIAKGFVEGKKERKKKPLAKVIPTVVVTTVKNDTLPIVVKASGSLLSKNRVELFSEVQGVFQTTGREFKPGVRYGKGDVFLKIDSDEQYANLQAQKSTLYNLITVMLPDLKIDYSDAFPKWQNYIEQYDIEKPIAELPKPSSTQEKIFVSTKNIYTTYYNIKSLEVRQEKYTLRAPFNGILTEALITPGTLVRSGQRLGEFISSDIYEMEVSVSISELPFMKVGKKVEVRSLIEAPQTWTGKVIRVNGKVDRASQTATVYLELRGQDLEEGMYLEAIINARETPDVFEIDRKQLVNEESIYAIRDSKLTLIPVKPVFFNTDKVIVSGLKDGEIILARSIPGAYEQMEVKILE